jgi:SSS family solute:Na+ symporter
MVFMFAATVILPFGLPFLPGLRASEYLSKTTHAVPVARTYTAREMDVQQRDRAIASWDKLNGVGQSEGERPLVLKAGEKFEKVVLLPKKSIFWSEGIDYSNGQAVGKGYLKAELIVLDRLGWDLSQNSYSLNETLTFIFRIIPPFLILMLVALLTKPQAQGMLDQFYGKLRTPVLGISNVEDEHAMELTRADPNRFNHLKLFPGSNWEFRVWNRQDWAGVIGSCVAAVSVVALLVFVVSLGR